MGFPVPSAFSGSNPRKRSELLYRLSLGRNLSDCQGHSPKEDFGTTAGTRVQRASLFSGTRAVKTESECPAPRPFYNSVLPIDEGVALALGQKAN